MNSNVGFGILFFSIAILFIQTSSFSIINAQNYHDYYNDNKANFAELERFDDKLFVCDNGIVVDDRTQCPLKCPFGTTLEGAYVMNIEICDIEPGTTAKKCPAGTDMEGVLVINRNQCDIFAECDADSPLGLSLGGLEPIKVADVQLCQLSTSDISICDSGFFEGFAVDNQQTCNTVFDQVSVCGPTTNLAGMLTTDTQNCSIFTTCDANSNLGEALGNTPITVADPELCNLEIPEQTELFICDLDTPMGGAIVTDELLCQAPNSENKCPSNTDLEGVYVLDIDSDCNIFATCDAGTPLGIALGMENEFKVADKVLCDLQVPEEVELFQCIGGPMQGAIVTDELLCQAPNSENKCPTNTDLDGVYVMDTTTDCNIYETCPQNSLQAGIQVSDLALCNVTNGIVCGEETANEGAIVTDEILCGNISPTQTITVNKTTSCDVDRLGQQVCDNIPDAKIMVFGNNTNPNFFLESQTPLDVTLEEGPYSIMEKDFVIDFEKCTDITAQFEAGRNLPQSGSDVFICSELSEACMGTAIGDGDNLLCNIENVVFPKIQDIVTANAFTGEISIFLGDGTGNFGTSTEFTVGGTEPFPFSVALGHFNADTNLDIVTANSNTDEISVFLGDGTGSYGTSTEFTVGGTDPQPESVAVGHFNADTNLDIVIANLISDEISVFLGDGTGSFGVSTQFTVGGSGPGPVSVAVGHFNADTNLDIVTANIFSDEISVFLGDGTGSFGTSTEFTVGGIFPAPNSVAVGHFNADTNLDIVTSNQNTNEISVFLGDGTGSFGTSTQFTVGGVNPQPRSVAVGHFNADTNLDIVTANDNSNEISVFLGDGTGSFGTSTQFTVGGVNPQPRSVAVGHFNADTNLDIVTANFGSDEISVFLGDGTGSFATSTEFTVGGTNPFPFSVAVGNFN